MIGLAGHFHTFLVFLLPAAKKIVYYLFIAFYCCGVIAAKKHMQGCYVLKQCFDRFFCRMCSISAEPEIAVGHWPFSDQFQDLAEQR